MAENDTNQEAKQNRPRKARKQSPRGTKKNTIAKQSGEQKDTQQKRQRRQSPRNNKNQRNRRPWRKHIPEGTVDPITLEELNSLRYPPFALHAAAPFLPVPQWPPKAEHKPKDTKTQEDPKQREQELLREQWGHVVVTSKEEQNQPTEPRVDNKHFNLFDGKALAIYMVSQQQFIDPLNRRDLSREELVELDRYLRKHGVKDIDVLEAYDAKGVSLSAAGAASTTAAGRAQILQEEAQVLLNALFTPRPNRLTQQYQRHEQAQQEEAPRPRNDTTPSEHNENGWGNAVYGDDEEGMMVIDDDQNPSMRGDHVVAPPATAESEAPELFPALTDGEAAAKAATPIHTWSGHHITHGSLAATRKADNFPALAPATKPKKPQGFRSINVSRERRVLEDQWGTRAATSLPRRQVQSAVKPVAKPAKAWGKTQILSVR